MSICHYIKPMYTQKASVSIHPKVCLKAISAHDGFFSSDFCCGSIFCAADFAED